MDGMDLIRKYGLQNTASMLTKVAAPPIPGGWAEGLGKMLGGFLKKNMGPGAAKSFGTWWGPLAKGGAFKRYMVPGLIAGGIGTKLLSD